MGKIVIGSSVRGRPVEELLKICLNEGILKKKVSVWPFIKRRNFEVHPQAGDICIDFQRYNNIRRTSTNRRTLKKRTSVERRPFDVLPQNHAHFEVSLQKIDIWQLFCNGRPFNAPYTNMTFCRSSIDETPLWIGLLCRRAI